MAVKDIYQLHGPIDTADLVDQVNRFMNRLMTRLDGSDSELASSLATLTANLADLLADFEAHNHAFVDLSDVDMEDVAHGDLPFRGASAWENLPAGEDGQILTTHGVDADPTWADQLEPADTVEDETTWGITPDAGTAETYSRSDHTHGTPAEPDIPDPSDSVESETTWGVSAAAGSSDDYSRADHTHGTPDDVNLGDATNYVKISDTDGNITWGGTYKKQLTMRPTLIAPKVVKVGSDYLVVPTQVDRGASSGYSLPIYTSNDEELFFNEYIPGRWDGASDFTVSVIGYLSAAEDVDDDFALQVSWANKSTSAGVFPATTTDVEVRTNIATDRNAQFSIYKVDFTINWDGPDPDVTASDLFCGRLRRIAVGAGYTEMSGEFVVQAITITYTIDKAYKTA